MHATCTCERTVKERNMKRHGSRLFEEWKWLMCECIFQEGGGARDDIRVAAYIYSFTEDSV